MYSPCSGQWLVDIGVKRLVTTKLAGDRRKALPEPQSFIYDKMSPRSPQPSAVRQQLTSTVADRGDSAKGPSWLPRPRTMTVTMSLLKIGGLVAK